MALGVTRENVAAESKDPTAVVGRSSCESTSPVTGHRPPTPGSWSVEPVLALEQASSQGLVTTTSACEVFLCTLKLKFQTANQAFLTVSEHAMALMQSPFRSVDWAVPFPWEFAI